MSSRTSGPGCWKTSTGRLRLEDFDGRIGTAVEEFVRWASPVMTFRRTATRDLDLGGQRVGEGDRVVMFYASGIRHPASGIRHPASGIRQPASGNRDEGAFTDPHRFDVTRSPNNHVGFGDGGPHFCMGNMLARTTQLWAIGDQLLHRVPVNH